MKLHKTKEREIFYYFLKSGKKRFMYRHLYYDLLGKRREKSKSGFKTLKDAARSLLELKAALLNNQHIEVENEMLTISQWVDIWYETYHKNWKVTSRLQRKNAIRLQIKPLLGKYRLNSLTKSVYIREYINVLLEKYKPSTVALFHRLFKIAINAAVEEELIPRNRFNNISIEQDNKLNNFLTPEELIIFIKYAKKHENITNYTALLTLAYTGLRRGELAGLKWKDIDFQHNTISVNRTRDKHGTRSPKTNQSKRTILIDDLLIKQLSAYQKWCIQTKFKYGVGLDKSDDYVFVSHQGGTPIGDVTLKYAIERIYKVMKSDGIKINRITPHGLRHTHCTVLISKKVQIKTIAERLGNTPEMIYNIYSHSFDELEQEAVNIFSETLNSVGRSVGRK